MTKTRDAATALKDLKSPIIRSEGVVSVSMSFESCLVGSHKKNSQFIENWVDSEIKKSSQYFEKEIYNED
jgi:hypothetical protein